MIFFLIKYDEHNPLCSYEKLITEFAQYLTYANDFTRDI